VNRTLARLADAPWSPADVAALSGGGALRDEVARAAIDGSRTGGAAAVADGASLGSGAVGLLLDEALADAARAGAPAGAPALAVLPLLPSEPLALLLDFWVLPATSDGAATARAALARGVPVKGGAEWWLPRLDGAGGSGAAAAPTPLAGTTLTTAAPSGLTIAPGAVTWTLAGAPVASIYGAAAAGGGGGSPAAALAPLPDAAWHVVSRTTSGSTLLVLPPGVLKPGYV
jgi:hypothetical protein